MSEQPRTPPPPPPPRNPQQGGPPQPPPMPPGSPGAQVQAQTPQSTTPAPAPATSGPFRRPAVTPPTSTRPDARPLGQLLVEMGFCNPEQLAEALSVQHLEDERVGDSLVRLKHCEPLDICKGLARQYGLPWRDTMTEAEIQDELVERLPISFARSNEVLPVHLDGELGELTVIGADPLKMMRIDDLAQIYDAEVELVLMPADVVRDLTNKIYSKRTKDVELEKKEEEELEEDEDILHASAEDAPIIRFVNSLIFNASKEKASDIHIEPGDKEISVRYRIDGVLHEVRRAPKAHLSSIIARVKIMSGLNIAEKRLPQDGRIRRKIAGKEVDMRVATVPTAHGERITIRLLDKSAVLLDLESIGIAPDHLRGVKETIHRPHGIFLVTGPTGSGKTTTLYSALSEINTPDLNILTVEDPVEFQLPGISQVQVQTKIDLTFARGLRSFLRHDPDVIMVGEIRDLETAEIAIQASLTGHLVLSTIHTNDAATGVTRLIDLGVQPFLVASSLVALQAQRLVRRVCPHCCKPVRPTPEELLELSIIPDVFYEQGGPAALKRAPRDEHGEFYPFSPPSKYRIPPVGHVWEANGCEKCHGSGYSGRTGLYELLEVSEEVRRLTIKRASGSEIKDVALRNGMRTLRDDGAHKVMIGLTTIEEVMRVTAEEA